MSTGSVRGDVCPSWCGQEHRDHRGGRVHPDDSSREHQSSPLDRWRPAYGELGPQEEAIEVRVCGTRHDYSDNWPDTITASNVAPGYVSSIELQVPDARRLAEALLLACDLADGIALPAVLRRTPTTWLRR